MKKRAGRPRLDESQKRKSLTIRLHPELYDKLSRVGGKKTEFCEKAIAVAIDKVESDTGANYE